jgi:DNA-binding NarL/FixJ family response regulator
MDVQMPVMNGIDATRRIAAENGEPPVRVLVLTTFDLDEYVFAALQAGASGFVLKTIAPDDLIDAVRLVADGQALLAPQVTRRLIERFAELAVPPAAGTPSGVERLTEREREVLVLIARGLSNGEIARTLFVGESTVRTHVKHILAKLALRDRVQAAIVAYEAGLVRPGQG